MVVDATINNPSEIQMLEKITQKGWQHSLIIENETFNNNTAIQKIKQLSDITKVYQT